MAIDSSSAGAARRGTTTGPSTPSDPVQFGRERCFNGQLCQLLEWIEDFEPRPFEVPVVPRGDREAVPTCGCRDVAIFDRHALTCLVEQSFLLRPHVGDRHIEPMDAS